MGILDTQNKETEKKLHVLFTATQRISNIPQLQAPPTNNNTIPSNNVQDIPNGTPKPNDNYTVGFQDSIDTSFLNNNANGFAQSQAFIAANNTTGNTPGGPGHFGGQVQNN